jgi:hypothetical protein
LREYNNVSGKSGVIAFEIGKDFIHVQFVNDRFTYVYNYVMPGRETVEEMKRLAKSGKGLSTFISQVVRDNYFEKFLSRLS